ncbi:MAG: fibronectin type III domain-containing protein [Elusimicrobiota bacterium]|nr:MAG: fibronectin type III domain-containing protein [Elusimicrobiota bacterium]
MMNLKTLVPAALAVLRLALPPSAGAAGVDAFGVAKIYDTVAGGKEWSSSWGNGVARTIGFGTDPRDSWLHGRGNATYAIDGAGVMRISGSTPRLYVHDPAKTRSWGDVEMTVYAMRVSDSGTAYGGIVGVARTNHTNETANPCDSRGTGARFRYDGRIDLEKETKHPSSVPTQNKPAFAGGLPYNKWIGWKLVVRDLPNGNVKLENYMDLTDGLNGGTWTKVNELEDNGANFGVGGVACRNGVNPALRLRAGDSRQGSETGKPNLSVYFRSDNVGTNGLLYKKMSVREVTASAPAPVDTTAPALAGVSASGIGQNGATIAWTTNEAADGQVEYGTTASYGTATALVSGLTTGHSVALSGLAAGTLYHYRVKSKDAAGNLSVSADSTFTTAAAPLSAGCATSAGTWQNLAFAPMTGSFTAEYDVTPAAGAIDGATGLSNGLAGAYSALAAAVRFNTSGRVDARNGSAYAAAAAYPYTAGMQYHVRLVVDLAARVYSAYVRQGTGPETLIGSRFAFRTEQAAATALSNVGLYASSGAETVCAVSAAAIAPAAAPGGPVISAVASSGVGPNGAMIAWTTDVTGDTQVDYGPTAAYGQSTSLDAVQTKTHVANLLALVPSTLYHYRVKSRGANGILTTSGDFTFTTPAAPAAGTLVTGSFYDDFKTYPKGTCYPDGASFGPWTSAFGGYGCTKLGGDATISWLEEAPAPSVTAAETHASMVLGPRFQGPQTYSFNLRTVAHTRVNTAPNPWEVAWIAWNYTDDVHFYYFALKPNGWELGKEDPAYPGAQRFLASGSSPVYPIGAWHNVRVEQDSTNTIKVYADDVLLVTFRDTERPYTGGRIGFYNEDSRVQLKDVSVVPETTVAAIAPSAAVPARAPQRLLSPARADGVNDSAVFGAAASEVAVYDISGRRVFQGSRSGSAPLVWNARDGAGRVVESGVYIARIRGAGDGVVYQSFVVAK